VFARRCFHRQEAHLVLSALRHRAAELGDQALFRQTHTYAEALDGVGEPVSVCAPTTWSSRDHVLRRPGLQVLAARATSSGRAGTPTAGHWPPGPTPRAAPTSTG
jgi:deoxyribodipyrimidine photolyase-related protein